MCTHTRLSTVSAPRGRGRRGGEEEEEGRQEGAAEPGEFLSVNNPWEKVFEGVSTAPGRCRGQILINTGKQGPRGTWRKPSPVHRED